ncbi:MAG: hypothetical protein RLZZ546_2985 [Bacteroidota bacterium]|jgi:hypothetical protein
MKSKIQYVILMSSVLFFSGCTRKVGKIKALSEKIQNITIMKGVEGFGPCEPSICISPLDQNKIIAGSVLDFVHFSSDGGLTWQNSKLKSTYGVFGDPVTIIDQKGKFYYAHLSNPKAAAYASEEFLDRIVVQTSDDGKKWTNGTYAEGDRKKDHDKHWLAINPSDNAILKSWTEFDKYGSKDKIHKSRILFSVSFDQGKTWSDDISISEMEGDCIDDDKTAEGAVPAVGIDNTYYIVWSYDNKIFLDISVNKGKTWMKNDRVIADQPGGWSFDIPSISRCNGMPVIKVDHSKGPNRGNIYVSWSDQRKGENDTDVWLISSSDHGKTWSTIKRVNDDIAGSHQFFSWMDVDPFTGNIYWVFYDRRNHQDEGTDVYLAYSENGGKTIVNKKISESPFYPSKENFFGDYNDISAKNGIVRPIWTRLQNGEYSVHTAIIDFK